MKECAIVGDMFLFTAQELHSDLALDGNGKLIFFFVLFQ